MACATYLTLRWIEPATIGWSYGLLDEQERLLWARLSVFAGGCEEDAVVQVCAISGSGGQDNLWAALEFRQTGHRRLGTTLSAS